MGSVDDRVVGMRFNNSSFERGVGTTLGTLDKLKKSLDFSSSTKGMKDLESAAGRFSLGKMGTSIQGISGKLLAMGTIGVTALANITNKAVDAGIRMAKSLTVAPIMQGFHEYETQLGSIQTILANTGLEGESGLAKVNKALTELNMYSDKTIYNFTEMARNIGTFTAAGVKLGPATSAIKGIANLAALSGSNTQQASTAMYQLSQAIANNKVGLQDWNSVVNAGMGGRVFQEALFNMAKAMEIPALLNDMPVDQTFDEWTKAGNSFRDSLKNGWITGEVLTNTLASFTGDMTDAQLRAIGFTNKQIKAIQKQAKVASDAATKVKTFTQLMDTLREAVGSGWAQTFAIIFGNFNEAKELWTSISDVVGGFINKSSEARNKVLKDWKALGGRTVLIDGVKAAFEALISVIKPIKDAFREIFPRQTGQDLYDLTVKFQDFMENLKMGEDTAEDLRRIFAGVFALFDIGKQAVSAILNMFADLFGSITEGSGGFLDFVGNIGDFIVKVDKALEKGDLLNEFFEKVGEVLAVPIALLSEFTNFIFGLFDGYSEEDASRITDSISTIGDKLSNIDLSGFAENLRQKIHNAFSNAFESVETLFKNLAGNLSNLLSGADFSMVLAIISTGLLGGLFMIFRRFFDTLGTTLSTGGGLVDQIKDTFNGLTGVLKAMQQQLQSEALLNIAKAVAMLTGSVLALSAINPDKMVVAFEGLTAGFAELMGVLVLSSKMIGGVTGYAKLPSITTAMVALAAAIDVLSLSVIALAQLDWKQLQRGLSGVGALFAIISTAALALGKSSILLPVIGVGLIEIATALNIITVAVVTLSLLKWESIGKGLAGIAGMLVAVGVGVKALPKLSLITIGIGLNEIAIALNILFLAMMGFAHMSWGEMVKGLVGIAGALLAISLGMRAMPKGIVLQAAALNVLGVALLLIGRAVRKMGGLSFEEIGKGLGTIAASLIILAVGLRAMQGGLAGASALLIAGVALNFLAQAVEKIGKMPLKQLIIGLGGLAAAIAILGLAALALSPVIPMMMALGVSIALIGGGIAAVGFGLTLIATALATLAATGMAGIKVLIKGIEEFITLLPNLAKAFAQAFIDFLAVIAKNGPTLVEGFSAILAALLQAIIDNLPKALELFNKLIQTLIEAIETNLPKIVRMAIKMLIDFLNALGSKIDEIVEAGAKLVINFLKGLADQMPAIIRAGADLIVSILEGIAKNIGRIVTAGADITVKFLEGVAKNIGRIIAAGANIIVKIIEGIGNALWRIADAGTRMTVKLIESIGENFWRVIKAGADLIIKIVEGIGNNLWRIINAGADMIVKFIQGIGMSITRIVIAATDVAIAFIRAMGDNAIRFARAGAQALVDFINGLADAIREYSQELRDAGANLAAAIIEGFIGGLGGGSGLIQDAIKGAFGSSVLGTLSKIFGWDSPATTMIQLGEDIGAGFVIGLDHIGKNVTDATNDLGTNVVDSMTKTISGLSSILAADIDFNPTITPVLDLTNVRKNASLINGYLSTTPLTTNVSLANARTIFTERPIEQNTALVPVPSQEVVKEIKFEQNNYSPKSLSAVEIYRQTKNQLALAREALNNQ
jgi:tape measure domain-containing protein